MRDAVVVRNEPAGTLLRIVTFDVVPEDHTAPGQWAKVRIGDIEAPFAFASAPGEPLVLLAKDLGAAGNALCAAAPGTRVAVGPAKGGFPLERVAGLPLVLLANGSGISALRPVVLSEVRAGLPRPVTLLYGVPALDAVSFSADLAAWEAAGVAVRVVPHPAFVQDAARELGLVRPGVGVLMAGVPAMIDAAKALWTNAGAAPDHLLVNF